MRIAVLVALLAGTAHADPRATKAFEAGIDAYRLGKHAEAREHLSKAIALDGNLPGPHRVLAAVAQAEGKFPECIAEARAAIELNPKSSQLAETRKLHDACRASAGRAIYRDELGDSAAIAVTSSVPGATVTISGLGYGGTPLAPRKITAGSHEVTVAKTGYRPAAQTVTALPGIVTDVVFELVEDATVAAKIEHAADTPVLEITDGDTLFIDGDRIAFRPREPVPIASGEHLVEIRKGDREPWRRRVRINGKTVRLAPEFEVSHARLRRRGWVFTGFAAGLLVTGVTATVIGVSSDGKLQGAMAVTGGLSGLGFVICVPFAVINLVRGRPVDRDAPPPFAIAPIEGGAIASKVIVW